MRWIVFGVFALASCGDASQRTVTRDGEIVESSRNGKSATITSTDGTTALVNSGAARLPPYAPAYPGARTIGDMRVNAPDAAGPADSIMMETSDAPDRVFAFYRDQMTRNGLRIGMESKTPQGGMIAGMREAGAEGAVVTVARDGGTTNITITRGPGG